MFLSITNLSMVYVADVARRSGFSTIMYDTDEEPATMKAALRTLEERRVDGIVLAPCGGCVDDLTEYFRNTAIPVVLIDRHVDELQRDIGALLAIRERGFKVPDDVSVIGFDDAPWAPLMDPPLSVINQSASDLGSQATQLLMSRLGDEAADVL